jgi:hypothetical protein
LRVQVGVGLLRLALLVWGPAWLLLRLALRVQVAAWLVLRLALRVWGLAWLLRPVSLLVQVWLVQRLSLLRFAAWLLLRPLSLLVESRVRLLEYRRRRSSRRRWCPYIPAAYSPSYRVLPLGQWDWVARLLPLFLLVWRRAYSPDCRRRRNSRRRWCQYTLAAYSPSFEGLH